MKVLPRAFVAHRALLMVTAGLLCLASFGSALAAGTTNLRVPLPAGETALTDILNVL